MAITSCCVFDCRGPTQPIPLGIFALDAYGDGRFTYGLSYIGAREAFSLDPIHLPLGNKDLRVPRRADGSYGVLSDTGPNAWGFSITLRMLRETKHPDPENVVEWFLASLQHGSGCLGFSMGVDIPPLLDYPITEFRSFSSHSLRKIDACIADPAGEIDSDTAVLLFPGGGLGGMRPKTLVIHDGSEHLAKFSRPDDLFDVPAAEYATLRLATRAGIDVPSFELVTLGERTVLLVERFDRKGSERIHYASAQSFINPAPLSADRREYVSSFSYAGIAEILRPIGEDPERDAHELFRRMVLNIMVGNVDDHLRNHAFLMKENGRYALSPVFDIVPHIEAAGRPQSIGVGKLGTASTIENALSQCERFLLKKSRAQEIITEVKAIASTWRDEFRLAGVPKRDIHTLSGCFKVADEADRTLVSLRGGEASGDAPKHAGAGNRPRSGGQ